MASVQFEQQPVYSLLADEPEIARITPQRGDWYAATAVILRCTFNHPVPERLFGSAAEYTRQRLRANEDFDRAVWRVAIAPRYADGDYALLRSVIGCIVAASRFTNGIAQEPPDVDRWRIDTGFAVVTNTLLTALNRPQLPIPLPGDLSYIT